MVRIRGIHRVLTPGVVEDAELPLLMTLLLGGGKGGGQAGKREEKDDAEIHDLEGQAFNASGPSRRWLGG